MGWKIVTGSDNAGVGHMSALKDLPENDPRVDEVIDVGVTGREDGTYYPNVASPRRRMPPARRTGRC